MRSGCVRSGDVELNTLEWGAADAPPVLMLHGMWDHARGFASIAPILAEHYRVIALDARGHGDSGWADAYGWNADVRDIVAVLRSIGRPVFLVGHSKGGGQATSAAIAAPDCVRKLVNIDGLGPPPDHEAPMGPSPSFGDGPKRSLPDQLAGYLALRRRAVSRQAWRAVEHLDLLVERRRKQNPRLSPEWLRYFAYHAARLDEDGWRWKSDPFMGHGIGIGPWQPDWIRLEWSRLTVPMLAIVGTEPDTWGPLPEAMRKGRLSLVPDVEEVSVPEAGHFVHMEQPRETARLLLAYFAS